MAPVLVPCDDASAMKIYTKTGDDGTTGIFGGQRVRKTSQQVVAYGTVDELNAVIGVARAAGLDEFSERALEAIQSDLFVLGAELACVPGKEDKMRLQLLSAADAQRLEQTIDAAEADLSPLDSFVLPGGSTAAALLHLARTVARRAEREVLAIESSTPRAELIIYLNRLSDLLFVLARRANAVAKVGDVPWAPKRSG